MNLHPVWSLNSNNSCIGPPRVAQLRVLFTLPSTIDDSSNPPLLAYVEWFTPFRRTKRNRGTFLYKVSCVYDDQGNYQAEVIPADSIIRSCHLLPVFGKIGERSPFWKSDNVLDRCEHFFFNEFLDLHTFAAFRVPAE